MEFPKLYLDLADSVDIFKQIRLNFLFAKKLPLNAVRNDVAYDIAFKATVCKRAQNRPMLQFGELDGIVDFKKRH